MKPIKPLEEDLEEMKKIEGYPIGEDKDILALSDPPYYTACPNPYLNDFIAEHGMAYDEETDDYHREPFVGDVSEGKNDPIYNAHSYHTKVPHKAIMKYIEHYTDEGDIVLDGFCGTGMTGVAAQLLNRKAILSDLSPIATFIAYNYNNPVDVDEFEREAKRILKEVEDECGWMYETRHVEADEDIPESLKKIREKHQEKKGKINYTVWSDVFICPYCNEDFVFWDVAVDKQAGKVLKEFSCPHCSASLKKKDCERAKVTFFDKAIGQKVTQAKQVPVLINYTWNKKRYEKKPDEQNLKLIEKIRGLDIPYWFPTDRMIAGDESRRNDREGFTHVHHFYTKRNLFVLSAIWDRFFKISNKSERSRLMFGFTAMMRAICKLASIAFSYYFHGGGGAINAGTKGTYYMSSAIPEVSVFHSYFSRLRSIRFDIIKNNGNCSISTSGSSKLNIDSESIDYIFTDPPFGDNLMYSELNYLWESWLKIFTNNQSEAIINRSQNKEIADYYQIILSVFKEYFRILKPNRWITVEFHNSKSSVWNVIQTSMIKSGFIIAQVSVLNKKQGSFKQYTAAGAVKNDLVISAYKPKTSFSERFLKSAGENLEIEFVRQFLENLPKGPAIERTEKMLYSKMLAYYVQHGYEIRYDSKSFYAMLSENFEELDGYWFNSDQTETYEEFKKKMKLEGIDEIRHGQSTLFISDEKSALIWLHQFLDKPRTFSDIRTAFNKLSNISDDIVPELSKLLEDNFVSERGEFRRPETEAEKTAISDKREKALMKEFESLLIEARTSKKKIKTIRKEALLFGFETCYKQNRFSDILSVANRLNKKIIENNAELSEFVEVAQIRVEGIS
ncbi:DNA methyltransferase [Desulfococcaceae bacterium HSG8]|nr:DNA methyltransferase [Desulfococcaceae bacterium HSG8]